MNDSSESSAAIKLETSAPAFVMDSAGIVVAWSTQAEEVFGWKTSEAVGQPLSDLIIPERHRAAHNAGLGRFIAGGGKGALLDRMLDLTMIDRSGREFLAKIRIGTKNTPNGLVFPTYIERD